MPRTSTTHFTAAVAETPFGGVGNSGHGREGGTAGLDCDTVTGAVSRLPKMPA